MIPQALKRINAVYLLMAVMIVVLLSLATMQLTWLERMAGAQLDRTLFVYQSDAEQLAAAIDEKIEGVYQSIRFNAVPRNFDDIELLFPEVQLFMKKKHNTDLNKLMSDIFWIWFSDGHNPQIQRYDPEEKTLNNVDTKQLNSLIKYMSG